MLKFIPEDGSVLDIGCGAGLIAAEITTRARVVEVDISSAQLELARRNAPDASLVRADVAEVAFEPRSFDAVVAFWSLIHVPRELHGSVIARIHAWLKPGGVFAGTLGSGDNPAEHVQDFYGAPMYWSHFDAGEPKASSASRLPLLEADEIEDEGETHLWLIATA